MMGRLANPCLFLNKTSLNLVGVLVYINHYEVITLPSSNHIE